MKTNHVTRRDFLTCSAMGAGMAALPTLITGCSSSEKETSWKPVDFPVYPDQAPDGKPLKAGLIGCGSRGTGAAVDFLKSGNGLTVTVLADVLKDRQDACREMLRGEGQEIPDDQCFIGFDAYQKVLESDVDIVLLCTPPPFRPMHFDEAVKAQKHIFMEKPCAVDPVGARSILVSAKRAEQQQLSVISGTVYRSQKNIVETWRRVAGGAIGDFVNAHVVRKGGALWHKKRQPGWSDMEYMLRNWINFSWLSGDHFVENFIHELDQMSWFIGQYPVMASANGGCHRQHNVGNQFDFFSVEYEYAGKMRACCSTRKLDGCFNERAVWVYGTKGYTNCTDTIFDLKGNVIWKYPEPKPEDADQTWKVTNPFVVEHARLVTAIRTNQPVNDAEAHVKSTLLAIMGRMAAYTGKAVTWDEVMASMLKIGPETYAMGPVYGIPETPPVPGML